MKRPALMLFLALFVVVSLPVIGVAENDSSTLNDTTSNSDDATQSFWAGLFNALEDFSFRTFFVGWLFGIICGTLGSFTVYFLVGRFQGVWNLVMWIVILGAVGIIIGALLVAILNPDVFINLGLMRGPVNDTVDATGSFVRVFSGGVGAWV